MHEFVMGLLQAAVLVLTVMIVAVLTVPLALAAVVTMAAMAAVLAWVFFGRLLTNRGPR